MATVTKVDMVFVKEHAWFACKVLQNAVGVGGKERKPQELKMKHCLTSVHSNVGRQEFSFTLDILLLLVSCVDDNHSRPN